VCIALATQITNTNKSLAPLSQQIEKALSRGWMGSPEKRETPFYNLKRIYKYDVDHNSGFNKKPLERFRDSIIDNSANPVSIVKNDSDYLNESPRHGKAIGVMVGLPAAIALILVTAPFYGTANSSADISGDHGHGHHGPSNNGPSNNGPSNNGPNDHNCTSRGQVWSTYYNKCVVP